MSLTSPGQFNMALPQLWQQKFVTFLPCGPSPLIPKLIQADFATLYLLTLPQLMLGPMYVYLNIGPKFKFLNFYSTIILAKIISVYYLDNYFNENLKTV